MRLSVLRGRRILPALCAVAAAAVLTGAARPGLVPAAHPTAHPTAHSTDGAADAASTALQRFAGADRYATSAQALSAYDPGVARLYVATGASFPDALAAGAAAGADNPVLLVNPAGLSSATAAAVARLQPGQIVLVGGPAALPNSIGAALAGYATQGWTRLAGPNRYATAAAIAADAFPAGASTVYLASGAAFPDALTASALGAAAGAPVLLTAPTALPAETAAALGALHTRDVVILGGTSAVSDAVASQAGATGAAVSRVSGADRYATNAAANAALTGPMSDLVIASGANFPDALSGAALSGHLRTALLLIGPSGPSAAQRALIAALAPTHVSVLGGSAAMPDAVVNQVLVTAGLAAPAPIAPAGADYVVNYAPNGQVWRWNPCAVIGWRLNPGPADATAIATIKNAVAELASASGLTFRYDGVTSFVPTRENIGGAPDDLIVAVVDPAATDIFASAPTAAGFGGIQVRTTAAGNWQVVKGYALLAAGELNSLPHTGGPGANISTLTLHELGHAVGLLHAAKPAEIMYPVLTYQAPATYSADDRAGLAMVGGGAGCIS
ncbi:MAG TPA: cell wall-binding repeat-containing protein [Acidothermaceae bacterium]